MRAHFAVENSTEKESLEERIKNFKENPEDMQIMVEFINNILLTAQQEAENKLRSQQEIGKTGKENSVFSGLKNGKIIHRARGVVTRLFDVLCNRANISVGSSQRNASGNNKNQQKNKK